ASDIEYNFIRRLIEEKRIPDDVTIQVLTQAREHLIRKTFDSVYDAKNAIVHLYNSTSTVQREVVFNKKKDEIKNIAVKGAALIRRLWNDTKNKGIRFEYTPESFPGTELDYAYEVCSAVVDTWSPVDGENVIINLPTTVEMSTPNVFADRVEWFCGQIQKRESIIISVHTHNDRGTAVASAELAVMAGAQRVEGALFGNGERSGNMDIITMALNIFSQGVDPELDFSDINEIADIYRRCTGMDVHPRHPYAGDLVYTAFSGSHQDAISKGMKAQKEKGSDIWDVPYLPIDPKDVGRSYEAIIRINSQSGKGGVAYVMENYWGYKIPKEMQPQFARIVQEITEDAGSELSADDIKNCFEREYLNDKGEYRLKHCVIHSGNDSMEETRLSLVILYNGKEVVVKSGGDGPVDAFVRGIKEYLNILFDIEYYSEHALSHGSGAEAIAYVGIKATDDRMIFGAGIDADISMASIKAVLSAINKI
ncbi:MAG: 2-isopropylmalate synthase, partial [Candidatus Omnitrophica bacterium]|nr:2-isopropylmalate synthase [Candidatus Omnitrophota bacterium]